MTDINKLKKEIKLLKEFLKGETKVKQQALKQLNNNTHFIGNHVLKLVNIIINSCEVTFVKQKGNLINKKYLKAKLKAIKR